MSWSWLASCQAREARESRPPCSAKKAGAARGWTGGVWVVPILAADAPFGAYGKTFPEAFERIDAGVQYLKTKGVGRVVLLGHSSGAMTAVAYAARRPHAPVTGIVAIGPP